MAQRGDFYEVQLKRTHLEWGTHRYTNSRERIYGEGYIPIPAHEAERFNLYNSTRSNGEDELGSNLFYCESTDGSFSGVLKAQGNARKGFPYAKQFSASGNLKAIGSWYAYIEAKEGDWIRVEWVSETEIEISKV